MSTYTMPLWKVIELTGGTVSRSEAGVRVMTGGNIGLNYLETVPPEHKPLLIGKLIDHYWNQEIGVETVSMFQLAMLRKANEIMPYYNKLYATENLVDDPISTIKIHTVAFANEVASVGVESSGMTESNSTSTSRAVSSEFPQVALSPNADYATSAADSNGASGSNGTASETKDTNTTADTNNESTTEGYQGYPARLLQQYRETILNIDMMVVNAFADCFMTIWNTNDDYSPYPDRRGYPFFI